MKIMSAKSNVLEKIKKSVHASDPQADVFLFGSRALGNNRVDSDWDLLILVDDPKVTLEIEDKFRSPLYDIELESSQIISSFIYAKDFWRKNLRYSPLYESVNKDGVRL